MVKSKISTEVHITNIQMEPAISATTAPMTLDQATMKIRDLENLVNMYRDATRREEKEAAKYRGKWEFALNELERVKDELCRAVMKKRKIRDHCLDQWRDIKALREDLKKVREGEGDD